MQDDKMPPNYAVLLPVKVYLMHHYVFQKWTWVGVVNASSAQIAAVLMTDIYTRSQQQAAP